MSYKKVVFTGLCLVLLSVLLYMSIAPGPIQEIQKGNLQYSEELGWINWDHALPSGPSKAYQKLLKLHENADDSFAFRYSQEMVLRLGRTEYVAEVAHVWKIEKGLSDTQLKEAFLHIFIEVSDQFETMQGKGKYAVMGASRASSFREGDLTGNLLAFYMALTGTEWADCKRQLHLLAPIQTLEQYQKYGYSTQHWAGIEVKSSAENELLRDLKVLLAQVRTNKKYGRNLEAKERFYSR